MHRTSFLVLFSLLLLISSVSFSQDLASLPFAGKYRKDAKTSIVRDGVKIKKPKTHGTLESLLGSLKHDDEMRAYYSSFGDKNSNSARKPEESENVEVEAYVWTIKFEGGKGGDNGFHVLLGSSDDANRARFMSVVVPGLPEKGSVDYDTLFSVRKKFLELFSEISAGTNNVRIEPARKVRICGSLFFDGEHDASSAGTGKMKPKTVWEIQPVYQISE